MKAEKTFRINKEKTGVQIKQLSIKSRSLSTARVVLFTLALVGVVYFANEKEPYIITGIILLFLSTFLILVKYHNQINFKLNHLRFLHTINKDELSRLNHNFEGLYEGLEFRDEDHPFSSDLDIFGDNSLFQLINRSGTYGGREKLADWFLSPSSYQAIQSRQEAIKELVPDISYRQNLQANAMHFKNASANIDTCLHWLEDKDILSKDKVFRSLGILLPISNIISLSLFLTGMVSYLIPTLSYGISLVIFGMVNKKIGDTFKKTGESVDLLSSYHLTIRLIEERAVNSSLLLQLKEKFVSDQIHASIEIARLKKIFTALETRSNLIYLMVDIFLLLDIYWVIKAENWRKRNRTYTSKWFNAIHQMEAINSLASFSYANPDYLFPEISEGKEGISTKQLGHPLIPFNERVKNDFELDNSKEIGIVTGSNMSGKSTFLRTIGVNLVLAFCGAPVCSTSFKTGIFSLFSSMRTHDSLKDHVSSFYAELKRLRTLIKLLENNSIPVFFLLDEILKGTNSKDRHNGARSLILQVLEENCMGLVSTHDLELSEIENEDSRILNLSFNSTIENNEVIFDYNLTQGVCSSFNATQLMGKMGIKIR